MSKRGIHHRDGELFGYLEGTRTYDLEGNQTGVIRGQSIFDMDGNRRWDLHGDAIMDVRGNVIGFLGDPVTHDEP